MFLYAGLAMRENVLRANGSDIRPWYSYAQSIMVSSVSLWSLLLGSLNIECSLHRANVDLKTYLLSLAKAYNILFSFGDGNV